MDQFINAREDVVTEAIDGLVAASGGRLVRLDGYPHTKVVMRAERDASKVAVISGGGSGHEPAHAGFVGRGMLTAAVCGEVFASPSVDAVLAGILAATGEAGCLLIVKNYTGDRLNFGLAAERARGRGVEVEMVVVADDVALDIAQPRGVAGTLFLHKIAGATAEAGAPLADVAQAARRVAGSVASIGLSLTSCTIPGADRDMRIPKGEAELGLGIHGEPGASQVPFRDAADAMGKMVERLAPRIADRRHAAILNNLGSATGLEMSILTAELMRSEIGGRIDGIVGPAPMMTSLDMRGVSISLLPLEEGDAELLAAEVGPWAWPGYAALGEAATAAMPDGLAGETFAPSDDRDRRAAIQTACAALKSAEADLNDLDAAAGDGDTGSTFAAGARSLEGRLDELPLSDLPALLRAIGADLSQSMGGSSGVLLALFFTAAGDAAKDGPDPDAALRAGLDRMREVGGAEIGDRTMIDALAPALDALGDGITAAAKAAREGAEATARMAEAGAGRAAYVGRDLKGRPDPGAEAVARVFEALAAR